MIALSHEWSGFYTQLRGFVAARVHAPADVDDLVQLVLERALRKAPPELDNVTAWLLGVARNAVADYYREHARRSLAAADAVELDLTPAHVSDLDRSFVLACLGPLLATLPPRDAQLLRWADMDDRAMQWIANELALSLSATKSRVQRARKEFLKAAQTCCTINQDPRGRVISMTPNRCAPTTEHGCHPLTPPGETDD